MAFGGPDCTGVLAPVYLPFFTASVSFVLVLLTLSGNMLVCLAVKTNRKRELRTPFIFFIVNLACADLVVGFVVAPLSVVIHLKEGLTDGLLGNLIPTFHMAYFISCTASVLSLAAMTIDRHIAVMFPLYYRATKNTRKVVTASLVIWIISASLPFVYFEVGFISYAFVFANTAIAVPLVILVVSNACIFRKMRRRSRNLGQLQAGVNAAARLAEQRELRLTKAFFVMLVAYLSCYTPSCAMIYIMTFCSTCSCYSIHWLRDMQGLFVLLNSCLNPIVYGWRIPALRKAAFQVITRRRSIQLQGRLNLRSPNNGFFLSKRNPTVNCKPNETSPPFSNIVTRREQSDKSVVVVNPMIHGDPDGKLYLKCVFDTRL